MPTFVSPFTGTIVEPTDVSYYALNFSANTLLYWPSVVNQTQVPAARYMECAASLTGLSISLPQANQGTLGADILISNTGAATFTVTDYLGNNAIPIASGVSLYFILTDNTTIDGDWSNVTFGASTSTANAYSLRGPGLTVTPGGLLATTGNVVTVSVAPSITDASRASTFVWTAGAGTFTLPNTATLSTGWFISFRNNGTGTLNITPTSPSTINGTSTIATNPGDSGIIFYSASSNAFYTVGWNTPNNVTFTAATYDMDSISGSTFSLVGYAPVIQTYVALSGTRTTNLTVTLPNITQLYVLINQSTAAYSVIFQVSGSSYPPVTLTAGQVSTIVVDGGQIFSITQSSTTLFYANNGSASTPAFSFTNDIHSGMYLGGTSILDFSANSTLMMSINNTNTSSPQITSPATFTATGGISGGTF